MITIKDLTKQFGDFRLDSISLKIGAGDYWVLLGPTGAGKSLLLLTLAGIHTPDSGEIWINGSNVIGAPPEKRNLGLVFQQSALFPHLSVTANILFGLATQRLPAMLRQQRFDEVVQRVDIGHLLNKPVNALSGGEAQKVALARALAVHPAVLLLDEPLAAVDSSGRSYLQTELMRLHSQTRMTTIHVTHHQDEARTLADHCALMVKGRVVQHGTMNDVLTHPRCSFVARFLDVAGCLVANHPPCTKQCLASNGGCDAPGPATKVS